MNTIQNSEVEVVKLLCNIYHMRNNGWIYLSILRGTMFEGRDVNVNIYAPIILFCESVSFDSGREVKYLGMETEEENYESRAYSTGYSNLEELIQNKESYCIITIPKNYYMGLHPTK